MGLLQSALAMPTTSFGGDYLHVDIFEMAAAYLFHLSLLEKGIPWPWWDAGGMTATGSELSVTVFRLLWVLVGIVVLVGLLRMQSWSWTLLKTSLRISS